WRNGGGGGQSMAGSYAIDESAIGSTLGAVWHSAHNRAPHANPGQSRISSRGFSGCLPTLLDEIDRSAIVTKARSKTQHVLHSTTGGDFIMQNSRLVELAIKGLEAEKARIEEEIAALRN